MSSFPDFFKLRKLAMECIYPASEPPSSPAATENKEEIGTTNVPTRLLKVMDQPTHPIHFANDPVAVEMAERRCNPRKRQMIDSTIPSIESENWDRKFSGNSFKRQKTEAASYEQESIPTTSTSLCPPVLPDIFAALEQVSQRLANSRLKRPTFDDDVKGEAGPFKLQKIDGADGKPPTPDGTLTETTKLFLNSPPSLLSGAIWPLALPMINPDLPSTTDVVRPFPLLSFPFDIIATIVGFACDETLISYSQTCQILRLCSCRIYLYRLGIIKSEERCTKVKLNREFPIIAIQILTSFPGIRSLDAIHLICDIFTMRHFYSDIGGLVRSSKVSCLTIHYHADETFTLWDSVTALALGSVLGSIQSPLTSVSICRGFRPFRHALAHNNPIRLRKQKAMLRKLGRHDHYPITFMETVGFLALDSALFPTPELRNIYTKLFTSASVHSLEIICKNRTFYRQFLDEGHFPNLSTLQLTVRDTYTIGLHSRFLDRHPLLDFVWLLNSPDDHVTEPVLAPCSVLKLPDVRCARIGSNYLGWEMEDISSLCILEIQPTVFSMPPKSIKFCRAVKSLSQIMVASNHRRLLPNFVLRIIFPQHLGPHLSLSRRSKDLECKCSTQEGSVVSNVLSLKLSFERLDKNVKLFLPKWLNWFPNITSLTFECDELDTPLTSDDFDAFRMSCNGLGFIRYNHSFEHDAASWRFHGSDQGKGYWAQQGF